MFSYKCCGRFVHRNDTSPNLDGVERYDCARNSNYSFDGTRANNNRDDHHRSDDFSYNTAGGNRSNHSWPRFATRQQRFVRIETICQHYQKRFFNFFEKNFIISFREQIRFWVSLHFLLFLFCLVTSASTDQTTTATVQTQTRRRQRLQLCSKQQLQLCRR